MKALQTRDPAQMRAAAQQELDPMFLGSLAAFVTASHLTHKGLESVRAPGIARHALPLAPGMLAMQLADRRFSPTALGISTGSFLASGAVVGGLGERLGLRAAAGMLEPSVYRPRLQTAVSPPAKARSSGRRLARERISSPTTNHPLPTTTSIVRPAGVLYLGEKIEGRGRRQIAPREGAARKLKEIAP